MQPLRRHHGPLRETESEVDETCRGAHGNPDQVSSDNPHSGFCQRSAGGPQGRARGRALLSDPGFIGEPDLYRGRLETTILRDFCRDGGGRDGATAR
jgi:hypothetical protein